MHLFDDIVVVVYVDAECWGGQTSGFGARAMVGWLNIALFVIVAAVNKRGFGCVAAEDERDAVQDQGRDAEQMDERCMRWTIYVNFTNDYFNVICIRTPCSLSG